MKTIEQLKANLTDLQREHSRLTALIAEVELVIECEMIAACPHKAGDVIKKGNSRADLLVRNVCAGSESGTFLMVSNKLAGGRWSKHSYVYPLNDK